MFILLAGQPLHGQVIHYEVSRLPFCTQAYDEAFPWMLQDGLLFTANRKSDFTITYVTEEEKHFYRPYLTDLDSSGRWGKVRELFSSPPLAVHLGPVCADSAFSELCLSRNLEEEKTMKNIRDPGNRLGLFFTSPASLDSGRFIPFPYNSRDYSITHPSLSGDGRRLYFASDMPGGEGGFDLYYSDLGKEGWQPPVNLGPMLNTPGNEISPFISPDGMLFYASDGSGGYGQQDLFYSLPEGVNGWGPPVHLSAPVNSEFDDFSLVSRDGLNSGYFASNREGTDDIYSFHTLFPQFPDCKGIEEIPFCYLLFEESYGLHDSLPLTYEWFSEGKFMGSGPRIEYCFPAPGSYQVRLLVTDGLSGITTETSRRITVSLVKPAELLFSLPDSAELRTNVMFDIDGLQVPGLEISEVHWDFDDGYVAAGKTVFHIYREPGTYHIRLGIIGKDTRTGNPVRDCFYKTLRIE